MRTRETVAAVLGALILQALLTGFTSLFMGDGSAYGAPFSVGRSCGFCIIEFGGGSKTLDWSVFALDVAVTAAVFWMLMRLGGHALLVPLGGVVFLILAMAMYFALPAGAPFAGIPVPIAMRHPRVDYPTVALLALWIDCMVGASVFAAPSVLRRRLGSRAIAAARH